MELGEDLLSGVDEIASYIGQPKRRIYHLLETGQLPAFKLGGRWTARRSTILLKIKKMESVAVPR